MAVIVFLLSTDIQKSKMEQILKDFMKIKCVAMHYNQFNCYGKGCNGQCQMFKEALAKLENKLKANK